MAIYRKTTPSSYPNTPASNFTDTSKHWRQHKNIYRKTSGLETASLTAVAGRYTDDTRTWRRIKAIYRFTSSNTWQKVFGKFAGQPYPETPARIRYSSYTGTDVGDFAMMGPGSEAIAQGESGTTFLWGRDGQDWQNIETLASRSRTFVYSDRPLTDIAQQVTNDEGNFEGDKLRNSEAVILQYDGLYVWYRDRISTAGTSTGTSYSQTVKIIKQQPVINSLAFKTSNTVAAGSLKYITYSIANQWYRSVNQSTSVLKWYILDTQYETPTEPKLLGSTTIFGTSPTETTTSLTGEDYFNIPETFNLVSTTGKWLHVKLICKNSSSDTDVEYSVAPYNDVTDYIVAQISGAVPIGTAGTVTMTRTNTSYTVSVSDANRGTWSNTPTSYRYQWYRRIQYDGGNYAWTPISGATSATYDASTYKPTDNSSGYTIIVPVVWASNGAGESNEGYPLNGFTLGTIYNITSTLGGITVSSPDSVNNRLRYKLPSITTFTITKGARKVTYVANFTADDPAVTTGTISWTGQATNNFAVGSSADTFTYQPLTAGTYDFTLTVTNSGANALSGSATATQNSIVVDDFSSYTFSFGNTFYVSTNGLIYLDVARGTQVPDGTSGRVIKIFPKDLNQGSYGATGATGDGFLLGWSDANDYVIRWDGYIDGQAGLSSYRLTYYVRFYKDQKYCDVYIQNKGPSVGSPADTPGFYFDGSILGASIANPAQGATFRIYLDGQTGSVRTDFSSELPVSADMVSAGAATAIGTNYPAADEGYTAITTSANLYTSPTLTIGTVTSNADSISVPYTTGGSYAKFDIDVKTTSHSGTSISGYPKTNQTTATPISISTLSGSTTYYITITPKNSKGQAGAAQTTSKSTTAALGAFTIYAYNASVAPSAPSTPTITRQSATSNNLLIEWVSTKPSDVSSYNEILWGDAFSTTYTEASPFVSSVSTINRYTSTATYDDVNGTYENYWVIQSSSSSAFNVKVQAVGTNASRTAGIAWGESTNAGSYTVEYTISGSSTAANNKSYTSSVLASTARSLTVFLGTAGGTVTINQVKAWSNTDGTGDLKYGSLAVGQSLSVTPTPATSSASSTATGNFAKYVAPAKPTVTTAPSVTRDAATNYKYNTTNGDWTGSPTGYTYQWYYYRTLQYFPYSETITISGATSSSYTSSATYVGYYIYCTVTATNAGGSNNSTSGFVQITTATSTNVANNKPQGAPVIVYDYANNTSTEWAYDVTITKSTIGSPEPEYYLQWFAFGNANSYYTQTGPYTSSGLGGSFTVQNVLVSKTNGTYGCQAWARNGVTGQDISNTAMSNTA